MAGEHIVPSGLICKRTAQLNIATAGLNIFLIELLMPRDDFKDSSKKNEDRSKFEVTCDHTVSRAV